MKKATMPKMPFTNKSDVAISTTGELGMTSTETAKGWKYDVKTGQFIADHEDYYDH